MKSGYRNTAFVGGFSCIFWLATGTSLLSILNSPLTAAARPQEQFGRSAEPKTSSGLTPASQQLLPEMSKVRYPLPARKSPTEQHSVEPQPSTGFAESTGQSHALATSHAESQFDQPYRLAARFHLEEATRQGYLILQVDLAPGAYIHSLTQENELSPSKVKASTSAEYRTFGQFLADRAPTIVEKDPVFAQRLEKHLGSVQFFVPLELSESVVVETLQPTLIFDGQVCTEDGICIPLRKQIVPAQFSGYFHRSARQATGAQK